MIVKQTDHPESDLPNGLSTPARRALASAGCLRLEQVAKLSEAEIRQMHGIGPNALEKLRSALRERGLAFAGGPQELKNKDNLR